MTRAEILKIAKPILFNAEMVRAILDNRKTVTRRVVKPQPVMYGFLETCFDWSNVKAPYSPGDILYVRETWRRQPLKWSCEGGYSDFVLQYRADFTDEENGCYGRRGGIAPQKWHPSIHMPKEAARLFLRVTGLQAERLQSITEDGAMQEGIQYTDCGTYLPNWKMSIDGGKTFHNPRKEIHHPGYHACWQVNTPEQCYPTARGAYHALWNSIYAKPRPVKNNGVITHYESYPWEEIRETRTHRGKPWYVIGNPWVWGYEFEKMEAGK